MKTLLFILMVLFMVSSARAQSGTDIHGRVTDERNASVPGAEVALSARSGAQLLAVTDSNGGYIFKGIAAGEYVVEVLAPNGTRLALRQFTAF